MANKREFKKYVETVGASVCEAMMATYYNEPSVDKKEITKAIEQVLCAVATARCNSNVTFDKAARLLKVRMTITRQETHSANSCLIKSMMISANN